MVSGSYSGGLTPERLKDLLVKMGDDARNRIQQEMLKQANRLADAQRAAVHVDSGNTKRSIRVTAGALNSRRAMSLLGPTKGPAGSTFTGISLRTGNAVFTNAIVVSITAGGPETTTTTRAGSYDHALAEEYGTHKMRPRPFFWNTYRSMRPSIEAGISDAVKVELTSTFGNGLGI